MGANLPSWAKQRGTAVSRFRHREIKRSWQLYFRVIRISGEDFHPRSPLPVTHFVARSRRCTVSQSLVLVFCYIFTLITMARLSVFLAFLGLLSSGLVTAFDQEKQNADATCDVGSHHPGWRLGMHKRGLTADTLLSSTEQLFLRQLPGKLVRK